MNVQRVDTLYILHLKLLLFGKKKQLRNKVHIFVAPGVILLAIASIIIFFIRSKRASFISVRHL